MRVWGRDGDFRGRTPPVDALHRRRIGNLEHRGGGQGRLLQQPLAAPPGGAVFQRGRRERRTRFFCRSGQTLPSPVSCLSSLKTASVVAILGRSSRLLLGPALDEIGRSGSAKSLPSTGRESGWGRPVGRSSFQPVSLLAFPIWPHYLRLVARSHRSVRTGDGASTMDLGLRGIKGHASGG